MSDPIATVQYRAATPADVEAIAELHTRSWRRAYRGNFPDRFLDGDLLSNRREVWRTRLDPGSDRQFVSVAVDGSRLAGFVCAFGAEDPKWGSFVDNLHVSEDHSRKGIGSTLMRQAGAWLASFHAQCGIYLCVWEKNQSARRFYEGLGAENAGVVERTNNSGGSSPNCRYVWSSPSRLCVPGPSSR